MNNLENVNDLITVPEMAKLLKISRSKAYSLIKQVNFPIIRIGKCIGVSRNSLEQWLNI